MAKLEINIFLVSSSNEKLFNGLPRMAHDSADGIGVGFLLITCYNPFISLEDDNILHIFQFFKLQYFIFSNILLIKKTLI